MASYWLGKSDQYPNTYNHDNQLLSHTRHSFRLSNVSCINKSRRRVVTCMDAISTRRAQAPDFAAAPLNKVLIVMSQLFSQIFEHVL
jgi:hypothetical protein